MKAMGVNVKVWRLVCVRCVLSWDHTWDGRGRKPTLCPPCKPLARAERAAAWAKANTAKTRAAKTRWRLENPERMAAARAAWEAAHPERRREYRRETKRKNPEANRSYVRARRMRLKGQTVLPISAAELDRRLAYFDRKCWMCGSSGDIQIDHVKPVASGGAHMLCNLRPACGSCNSKKGDTWPFPIFPSSSRGLQATKRGPLP